MDVAYCAAQCRGISTMFIFGTRSLGLDYSHPHPGVEPPYTADNFGCFCEKHASSNGTCNIVARANFNLYKFT